ncbi:MAG: hypothetical protein ACJAZ0_001408 [Halioglobus sp.]|jgi:hypothetical protein
MALIFLKLCIVVLNAVMAFRAFQSGTLTDRLLGAVLVIGLILFFTIPTSFSACWLMACAGVYLVSQVMTSARPLSRGLPILAGALAGVLCWAS